MAELKQLWLQDFRNYNELALEFPPGRVVVTGRNGQGKSNLLEAIGYLGTLSSFRGASTHVMIAAAADQAFVRGQATSGDRELLIEVELSRQRPNRGQVNKQRLSPVSDLAGMLPVTVFGPDDLELVKAGPSLRRRYLDDLLVQLHQRNAKLRAELDRILRQRNAVLRQARGRSTPDIEATLDVWDAKLAEAGEAWGTARSDLVDQLAPETDAAYEELAGTGFPVTSSYAPEWREKGLAAALAEMREDELRRGVTLVGPHRDELHLEVSAMPARTHASQGEQRTLALAMRIAGHHVVGMSRGTSPLLLLDDVFSELDSSRADALLQLLVADQTFITTAADMSPIDSDVVHLVIDGGVVQPS